MPNKIVLQKYKQHELPLDFELSCKQDDQKNKSLQLKNRLVKKIRAVKPGYSNRKICITINNFKSKWFCKSCFKIFYLTPKRKFKTLLEYDLSCRNCQSKEIMHNEALSAAINNKLPVADIIKLFKDSRLELEFVINSKAKFQTTMIYNSPSKDKGLHNCVGIL